MPDKQLLSLEHVIKEGMTGIDPVNDRPVAEALSSECMGPLLRHADQLFTRSCECFRCDFVLILLCHARHTPRDVRQNLCETRDGADGTVLNKLRLVLDKEARVRGSPGLGRLGCGGRRLLPLLNISGT